VTVDQQSMALFRSIREHLVTLARSERGMALPTALFAMLASMGLATAAILASVDVQQGSTRDSGAKKSIAAADAGASVALLRLNRFKTSLSTSRPCIGPNGEPQTPSGGWCPAIAPEKVGAASYSYAISAYQAGGTLSVISVGTDHGVSRRVKVGLITADAEPVFANEKLVLQGDVEIKGNTTIDTDVGTNGDIEQNGAAGVVCGDVRKGKGKYSNVVPSCGGHVTEGEKHLPEVLPPENIATENSNCRLSWTCTKSTDQDTYCSNKCQKPQWNSLTRTLEVDGNSTLTLGGRDYFLCNLTIKNGTVIMAAGAEVRIFFDTPENCGPMSAGALRLNVGGNASLTSTGFDPEHEKFDIPELYFLGSKTIPTSIYLKGGSGTKNEFLLYAPNVNIEMEGNAEWIGMMAGNTLNIHGTPKITSDPNIKEPEIEFETLFARDRYVECTGATASPPDANC
jgi:hypothetical protein